MLLAAAGLATGGPALAAVDVAHIGIVGMGSRQQNQALLEVFRAGLAALGWREGANLVIFDRWAEDRAERLPAMIGDLLDAGADLLVTIGTPATLAARAAMTAIPVLFVGVSDPVAIGAVETFDRPGGNATGLSLNSPALILERLRALQELVPELHRLAIIVRDDPGFEQTLMDIHDSAARMGLEAFEFAATTGRTLELSFIHLRNDRCEALYLASGPLGPAKRAQVIALAAQARLPAVYGYREFVGAGGLMSLAADMGDLSHRAASFADRILKGANPGDLPAEPPTKLSLALNLKTARSLGLAVPPSLLARADEVIE